MKKYPITTMKIADLKPADYNPRKISKEAMAGLGHSLKRFGLVQPIIWNRRTGNVVGGHQRLKVLSAAGETVTDVIVVDLPMLEEKALNVTLNNPHISGDFAEGLDAILSEIQNNIPDAFLELRLSELTDPSLTASILEDEIPPLPKKPVTQPGDLWQLGPHRLLCGDSTDAKSVNKVLDDKSVPMIFTDPPWNVAIGQTSNPKHRQREGLVNDDLGKDFAGFLNAWTAACLPFLTGDLYCVMSALEWAAMDRSLREAGMHWSATIIWVKQTFVLGRSNYHKRYEPIWYGWPKKLKSSFTGQRDVDDVWEIDRPVVSAEHPTMKPVELVARAVNNSSRAGQIVFDPFSGAGSTLMACTQLNRLCRGIEIDPGYCDVIIERWQKHTDGKALRV